jgi:hypothetical protein
LPLIPPDPIAVTRVGVGVIGTATASGAGAWSFDYTLTVLPAGNHSFTATATDTAGNISAGSAAFNVTIDITAPAAPSLTGITSDTGSSGSDGITSDQALLIAGTAEANSTVTVTRVGLRGQTNRPGDVADPPLGPQQRRGTHLDLLLARPDVSQHELLTAHRVTLAVDHGQSQHGGATS